MKLSKLAPLIGVLGLIASYASSISLMDLIDSDLFSSILKYPGNFTHSEEEVLCERMVDQLTPDEQETASRTSYAYWLASLSKKELSLETRKLAAKKEALRHLVAENGNLDSAMTRFRETCNFRKVRKNRMKV